VETKYDSFRGVGVLRRLRPFGVGKWKYKGWGGKLSLEFLDRRWEMSPS
jgi:hypothetical protein